MKRSLGAFRESEDLPTYLDYFSIFSLQIHWTVHVARSINRSDRYLFRGIFRNRLAALSLMGKEINVGCDHWSSYSVSHILLLL